MHNAIRLISVATWQHAPDELWRCCDWQAIPVAIQPVLNSFLTSAGCTYGQIELIHCTTTTSYLDKTLGVHRHVDRVEIKGAVNAQRPFSVNVVLESWDWLLMFEKAFAERISGEIES